MSAASLGRDVEPLGQAVGLHAVGQAVGDHLRLGPLLDRDVAGLDAEHPRRRGGVDVLAGRERRDEARVLGQVGDAAQLDLVVVGDQQLAARRRHERPAERAAHLGAHRDVVQVGLVGRQPAGAGHGLVERGVDAPVGGHLGQQPLAVGRAQLLDLAVAQQVLDDRVLARQLLERRGVGGVAGLGLLLRRQAELVEQDRAQLRRGVDVELVAGVLPDLAAVGRRPGALRSSRRRRSSSASTPTPTSSMRASTRTSGTSIVVVQARTGPGRRSACDSGAISRCDGQRLPAGLQGRGRRRSPSRSSWPSDAAPLLGQLGLGVARAGSRRAGSGSRPGRAGRRRCAVSSAEACARRRRSAERASASAAWRRGSRTGRPPARPAASEGGAATPGRASASSGGRDPGHLGRPRGR